jgi:hypothetical protein
MVILIQILRITIQVIMRVKRTYLMKVLGRLIQVSYRKIIKRRMKRRNLKEQLKNHKRKENKLKKYRKLTY